ncbi:M48 family peptidase [Rhodosalinus sediminis]|uniref:M48 family peptidase n=1 Tax=Rhodosalinus sediminis TaxID=1940533 RepID=A0A3D9BYV2_9RHOB|nr:SprT family zinc-dependent metalloprotease [Rhodosalinus sediminis]REC58740.1 M48 family peptidase [Rhodosalinus sediminis]
MGQRVLPGNPPLTLTLRRSARARRIALRVSALDGTITLTVPRGASEAEALDFARAKADWLRARVADRLGAVVVGHGAALPVEGRTLTLAPGAGRRVQAEGAVLRVPGPAEQAGVRTQGWLKALARERLAAAADRHAASLGRPYARITLRDTRSRWGSCSDRGALSFSWRLVMAPPEVLDYVAAHEVAHLAEMNHSAAFWAVVRRLYGPHEAERRWLHEEGPALHRYRFGAH